MVPARGICMRPHCGSLAAPRRDAMQCTTTRGASSAGGWPCRVCARRESEPRDFYAGLLERPLLQRCTTPSCYIASQVSVTRQDNNFQRSPYYYRCYYTSLPSPPPPPDHSLTLVGASFNRSGVNLADAPSKRGRVAVYWISSRGKKFCSIENAC